MNDQIDPSAVLREAVELTGQGRYEEALYRLLWFHQHALEHCESLSGVRLSYALSYWLDLGQADPPAMEAMRAIRDAKEGAMAAGGGSRSVFHDVTALNSYLSESPRTADLFRLLDAAQPELAQECYSVAEEALVAQREYDLCARYITDLDARLDGMKGKREFLIRFLEEPGTEWDEGQMRTPDYLFAKEARHLIEILDGAGRTEEADRVWEWTLAISNSPEVRETLGFPPP